jgi:beta-glucosidase
LLAWQPGQEGGHAVADVLSGKVNPSGKLATTFPVSYADVPFSGNFPGKLLDASAKGGGLMGAPSENTYEEGIYVGYRYYNTFKVKPAYEFGYGLSYTTFTYGPLTVVRSPTNDITARVSVTNSGKVAGKEVVQLYVSAPKGSLDKPESELKAFAKTNLLQPGQSQTFTFKLQAADLASFNTTTSSWVADAGTYTVKVGASSQAIKGQMPLQFPKAVVTEKSRPLLVPQQPLTDLRVGQVAK